MKLNYEINCNEGEKQTSTKAFISVKKSPFAILTPGAYYFVLRNFHNAMIVMYEL